MKEQIKIWGSRVLGLAIIVFAIQHWGVPLYRQYFAPKKVEVYIPTTRVKQGLFTISFPAIGTLEAEKSVAVTAGISGKIIYLINDGAMVSQGDLIALLDSKDIEREIRTKKLEARNAEAEVMRAQAELQLLQEANKTDLMQAQAQLDFDKNELKLAKDELAKMERLLAEKLVTGEQVEQARGEVRSKELAVMKGEAQLELKKKECESKEKQKMADVKNVEFRKGLADEALAEAEDDREKTRIRAPAAGLVVLTEDWMGDGRRKLQEGDNVRPQQTICRLPDLSKMMVKVRVGEADAPRVRLDMPVLIRLEAVPNKVFHGRVVSISSLATELSPWEGGTPGKKDFEVKVSVKENNPRLIKPGMTANLEFIVDQIKNAIYIPIEAVVEQGNKTFVYVKSGGKFTRVPIKTGKYNDNFVCVTKGLKKGQVIALRDPTRELELQEAGSTAPGVTKQEPTAPPVPKAKKE